MAPLSTSGNSLPPSYTTTCAEPPAYSSTPACDERMLQLTPRTSRPTPTGTFVKSSGAITVSLFDQEDGASIPTYGRHGAITGLVNIKHPEKVSSVTVKIEGKIDQVTSEAGSHVSTFLSRSSQLWRKRSCEDVCPDFLPFASNLPATFTHGAEDQALPPSFKASHPGVPALFLEVKYHVVVHVAYSRYSFDLLGKNKVIEIPFTYAPRTRAHRPIIPNPCIFSAVKTSPDEWYQVHSPIRPRSGLNVDPVEVLMFIPAARVYGIRDKIPFHIQLNGPVCSLRKFVLPETEIKNHSALKGKIQKHPIQAQPIFTVKLVRQSAIDARGQNLWKNATIGVGDVIEVPPELYPDEPTEGQGKCPKIHLDWKGEVQALESVKVGGFSAMNIAVKDFLVLSIQPPAVNNEPAPFLNIQITIPIRLVTDPYLEVTDYEVDNLGT